MFRVQSTPSSRGIHSWSLVLDRSTHKIGLHTHKKHNPHNKVKQNNSLFHEHEKSRIT